MNTTTFPQRWNADLYAQHAFVWQYGESLIQLLAPEPGERILDLGCGTGQLTAQIAAIGAEVLGIDRSEQMIQQAQANYPNLTFRVADAAKFRIDPSIDRPFDAVFSNAVLHWIPDADAVIQSVRSILRPQGRFVAEFGGKGNVEAIVTAIYTALTELGVTISAFNPWYFPSISDYTTRLEQQGFEVQLACLFDRPTSLADAEAGLTNWLRMFAGSLLSELSPEQFQQVANSVETQLRSTLYQQGSWIADYRRLRIVARKL